MKKEIHKRVISIIITWMLISVLAATLNPFAWNVWVRMLFVFVIIIILTISFKDQEDETHYN